MSDIPVEELKEHESFAGSIDLFCGGVEKQCENCLRNCNCEYSIDITQKVETLDTYKEDLLLRHILIKGDQIIQNSQEPAIQAPQIRGPYFRGQNIEIGESSPNVENLKKYLQEVNIFKGDIHRDYDESLTEAVKIFQRMHDLQVDGQAGPQTLSTITSKKIGHQPVGKDSAHFSEVETINYYLGVLPGHLQRDEIESQIEKDLA